MHPGELVDEVLNAAIAEVAARELPVFTFALYFDHESEAISVCVDTEENSARTVAAINSYNARHFHRALADGDLKMAELWQANIGRSLSLGDFALVNVARREMPGAEQSDAFFLLLMRKLVVREREIAALCLERERLVLACSGVASEVAYVWSANSDA